MLVIEDGSGVLDANSYVTIEETDAFLAERRRTAWEALDESEKEANIIRAADFLNTAYRWSGEPLTTEQSMALPTSVVDFVARSVRAAQMLLAYEASQGELAPTTVGSTVTKERKKLDGVGEKEVTYATGSSGIRSFPAITALLAGYAVPIGASGVGLQSARRILG